MGGNDHILDSVLKAFLFYSSIITLLSNSREISILCIIAQWNIAVVIKND